MFLHIIIYIVTLRYVVLCDKLGIPWNELTSTHEAMTIIQTHLQVIHTVIPLGPLTTDKE